VVTKKAGSNNDRPRVVSALHDKWEETLTQTYKHKSDTEQERKAIQKANLPCTCPKITDKELKEVFACIFRISVAPQSHNEKSLLIKTLCVCRM
jgi:hypothetical protein